jgi:H+/Cl- antiporter ClcA
MPSMQKYLKRPRLRTRESLLSYVKKWIILSTVLGLLTGIVVALFDFATNLLLWTYFSSLFSHNYLFIIPAVVFALLFSGFLE